MSIRESLYVTERLRPLAQNPHKVLSGGSKAIHGVFCHGKILGIRMETDFCLSPVFFLPFIVVKRIS